MKHALLLAFLPLSLMAQLSWTDNFNDSNYTQNPVWAGNDSVFIINSSKQLQLDATTAGSAYLSTPSSISDSGSWVFDLMMDFNPSTSNHSKVYLISDNPQLQNPQQAFYVSFGGTTEDKICLHRQQGHTSFLVAESSSDLLNLGAVDIRVKVDRNNHGLWTISLDSSGVFKPVSIGVDSTQLVSSFFGVRCFYTKTRADKFYFDNFSVAGNSFQDSLEPLLDSIQQTYKNSVQLFFNEEVEKTSSELLLNYQLLPDMANPIMAIRDSINVNRVELQFQNEMQYGINYQLEVKNVEDGFGNLSNSIRDIKVINPPPEVGLIQVISNDSLKLNFKNEISSASAQDNLNIQISPNIGFPTQTNRNATNRKVLEVKLGEALMDSTSYQLIIHGIEDTLGYTRRDTINLTYYIPKFGDVVINELMIDPEPIVGRINSHLPKTEYIELYNRSNFDTNLEDWSIKIGTKTEKLPSYLFAANTFLLLVSESADTNFPDNPDLMQLPLSASALNNSSARVSLFSDKDDLITSTEYQALWLKNENKASGGWSLEKIDPNWVCENEINWKASINIIGGTPGTENSVVDVLVDENKPTVDHLSVEKSNCLNIHFSEAIDGENGLNKENYATKPQLTIDSIVYSDFQRKSLSIYFKENMEESFIYEMQLKNAWVDCFGNPIEWDSLVFGVPEKANTNDLVINEILFNPAVGGSDYVEVYNPYFKIFDLSKLYLGNIDPLSEQIINAQQIKETSRLFLPGEFLVFTEDTAFVNQNYSVCFPQHLIEVNEIPAMADDEGSVALSNSNFEKIDYLQYSDEHQLSALSNTEGVSLERIHYFLESNDSHNWQSAASTSGFGTPSSENSQKFIPELNARLNIKPKVFTPNQDGFEDFATFNYSFSKSNYVISVKIWNTEGNVVKVLNDGQNVGQSGWVKWDGINDDKIDSKSGIYIITLQYIHEDGDHGAIKDVCVLSR